MFKLEFREYIDCYMDSIGEVLRKTIPDYDENCSRSIFLLTEEEKIAEQDWYNFVTDNRKKPDREFLFENIHRFGVDRADFFDANKRQVPKDDFIDFYLNEIKNHSLMKETKFEAEDRAFILNREKFIANEKFDERTNPATGYDELNITTSKKTQEWLLQALILRFERDFGSFYIGLQAR
ncbi:hypothetical protein D922_01824 [Enterococcus faecalis 06-MB-DW-09]|nr:hypothetical protein D922_01824 [Enterococcus faecalis 06-MB-DW-09]